MGGNDSFSPESSANASSSNSGHRTSVPPIQLLVFFHKAFRGELQDLRHVASIAANSSVSDKRHREFAAVELKRRLEFFRSVFSYHCAGEDEVIFFALDSRVKNIASTYFLEHQIIDSKFETTFSCLNGIIEDHENPCQEFQELTFHLSALEGSICRHMTKEEQQVFPLLMTQFSDEEQSSLLWQLICSVPVILMEDFFSWLTYFLTPQEQLDLKYIMKKIVPQDKLLQEVVISWMNKTTQPPSRDYLDHELSENLKGLESTVKNGPFDGLFLWHASIKSDFKEILDKLYNKKYSNLSSLVVRINFLMDVLIFYGDALERIFYPLLEDVSVLKTSSSYKGFPFKNEFEEFQKVIFEANQIDLVKPRFLKMLCEKVENLAFATSKHLSFQETEVFPLITKKYDQKIQQKLLFKSLLMLPLGLLKCVATWFSPHLSKNTMKCILYIIEKTSFLDKPFSSLLQKWVHIGYCGKSTIQDLQEMFNSRISFMFQQFNTGKESTNISKNSLDNSTFFSNSLCTEKHGTLYSSGINLLVFSSRELYQVYTFSASRNQDISTNYREPRPLDHIYYFHKAIKKDLESLVLDATKLSKNLDLFVDFNRHFRLVQSFYELHSETEDQVAFPALEAKQKVQNLTKSYTLDHNLEDECFNRVSGILDEMSELYKTLSGSSIDRLDPNLVRYNKLCLNLQDSCQLLEKLLSDHIHREEVELWPLFREYFSIEEQERIVGYMLGRTRAEILQKMIVWLMDSLTLEEQQAMMNFWRKATTYTKFDEWLGEWWEGMERYVCSEKDELDNSCSSTKGCLDIVSSERVRNSEGGNVKLPYHEARTMNVVKKMEGLDMEKKHKGFEYNVVSGEKEKQKREGDDSDSISEMEAAIRKVSQDPSLDLQEKTRMMQDLMTSHWISPPLPDSNSYFTSEPGKLPGQFPSYRDSESSIFGCKHYKQNCKLVASCCDQIVSCRRCHDEVSDHVMDRKSITHMMCMKCLEIQPIGPICVTCKNYSMARYYCKICRLFDDSREIYHCPYCNLCRLGKGLGIDYFHCMKCNACMSRSLSSTHICREKCIEDKCPICHEDMFTSRDPVKALPCGHLMHSSCFEDYTCTRYTCPVCSKSLGDMQVLFGMLDALLAEEKMPEEYISQTQAILCNDCEKKGIAPFHWLYHKCPFCGSYNTRLI